MATRPKTDPLSLRRRVQQLIAKDIRAIEAAQKANPKAQLDPKTAAQLVSYSKALNEQLQEEEMWARKMLAEAAKLSVDELMRRAGTGQTEEAPEDVEAEDD